MMDYKDFANTAAYLEECGMNIRTTLLHFHIKDAKEVLRRGITFFCNRNDVKWVEGYDSIAEWMGNNQGKGLLLMGGCGLGKTLITTRILPVVFKFYFNKILSVFYADHINKVYLDVEKKSLAVIDDIGVEGESNTYGDKKMVMKEIVDHAERTGQLLIMSTNLTEKELATKYDARTIDRLKAITRCIVLNGDSNRK